MSEISGETGVRRQPAGSGRVALPDPFWVGLSFAVSVLLLLMAGVSLDRQIAGLQESSARISHSRDVQIHLLRLQARVTAAGADVRDFLATGYPDFNRGYVSARVEVAAEVAALEQLTAEDAVRRRDVGALDELIQRKWRRLDQAMAGVARDSSAAASLAADDAAATVVIEQQITRMITAEEVALAAQRESSEQRVGRSLWLARNLAVVGAALLFFAFGWLAVAMHIRGRAERSARRLAADLDLRQHELMRALAERDAAEALREIRERRLRQDQVMAMVGRLAGGLAHVLGNALTSIIGHAELLQGEAGAQGVRGPATHILENARKAAKLTTQFRAFGQGQILVPERVDLNQALRDLRDLVVPILEPAIAVDLRCEARNSLVSVDRQGLLTALAALAENAAEAMPGGGRLRLETKDRRIVAMPDDSGPDAAGESAEAVLPPGNYVEVTVADTGGGMNEEIRQHAFEPFFTTKDASLGAGLGLSMVYGFARQSGGAALLRGGEGSGSEISILLPALDSATPLGRPAIS